MVRHVNHLKTIILFLIYFFFFMYFCVFKSTLRSHTFQNTVENVHDLIKLASIDL